MAAPLGILCFGPAVRGGRGNTSLGTAGGAGINPVSGVLPGMGRCRGVRRTGTGAAGDSGLLAVYRRAVRSQRRTGRLPRSDDNRQAGGSPGRRTDRQSRRRQDATGTIPRARERGEASDGGGEPDRGPDRRRSQRATVSMEPHCPGDARIRKPRRSPAPAARVRRYLQALDPGRDGGAPGAMAAGSCLARGRSARLGNPCTADHRRLGANLQLRRLPRSRRAGPAAIGGAHGHRYHGT